MTTRHSPSTGPRNPDVWGLYEPDTGSIQYVCACPRTRKAALIDVVLNFDPASAGTSTRSAEAVLDLVARERLEVAWVLDTHPHADHMMASAWLREQTGAPSAIGTRVAEIAGLWQQIYQMPDAFDVERDFDRLFAEGDSFRIGELEAKVWLSPGHTLGSITYLVGDAGFVHDTLMYPDSGSSRADFPGASVHQLWDSLQRILALPAATRLFVGHDYCKGGARADVGGDGGRAPRAQHPPEERHHQGRIRPHAVRAGQRTAAAGADALGAAGQPARRSLARARGGRRQLSQDPAEQVRLTAIRRRQASRFPHRVKIFCIAGRNMAGKLPVSPTAKRAAEFGE